MAYMKNFPSQPTPFFWAILTNYLISIGSDASEQEKRVHGLLAYRMLEKAAADVPQVGKKVLIALWNDTTLQLRFGLKIGSGQQ